MGFVVARPPDTVSWWLAAAVGGLVSLYVGSIRFAWRTLMVVFLLLVVISVAALVRIGIDQTEVERLDAFARSATAAQAELVDLQDRPPPTLSIDAAREAVSATTKLLEQPTDATPDDVTTQAKAVLEQIDRALDAATDQAAELEAAAEALADLSESIDGGVPADVEQLRTSLLTALNATRSALALDESDRKQATIDEASVLVDELCRGTGRQFEAIAIGDGIDARVCKQPKNDGETSEPDGERMLTLRKARAELAVAQSQLANALDDATEVAAELATERSQAVTQALADISTPPESISIAGAIGAGAGAVVSDLFETPDDTPFELDLLGWLMLALGLLGVIRLLSVRNAGRDLGPVKLTAEASAEVERFRTFLLRNVPEPGQVPGANAIEGATQLVVALEPVVKVSAVGAALAALKTAVLVERGYVVEYADFGNMDSEAAGDPAEPATTTSESDDAGAELVVRVRHARTTELLNQRIVRGATRQQAIRTAAYWAAAVVINTSRQVPQWAHWEPASAEALATYHEHKDLGNAPDIATLRRAVNMAPNSGLLGMRLAYESALADQEFEAFSTTLRTVRQHPRYLDARYRLAVSASLLAAKPELLSAAQPDIRLHVLDDLTSIRKGQQLSDALDRYFNADNPSVRDENEVAKALCEFAVDQLGNVRYRIRTVPLVWNSLRSDERSDLSVFMPFRGRRRDMRSILESCPYAIEVRKALASNPDAQADVASSIGNLMKKAREFEATTMPRTPNWQVPYNLACFWSLASTHHEVDGRVDAIQDDAANQPGDKAEAEAKAEERRDRAFLLLEAARRCRGGSQLTAEWLRTDSDLAPLRADARWKSFLAHTTPAEQETS